MALGSVAAGAQVEFGRILVVDPDTTHRCFVASCLEQEGFSPEACGSGADARRSFAAELPDLVAVATAIDDLVNLCTWIRARSSVPIVLLALPTSDPVHALDVGADAVVRVPAGPSELVARVRAVLRRAPAAGRTDEVLEHAGLRLHRHLKRLELAGRTTIALDGRELALMELLLLGGGRVVGRALLRNALQATDSELDGHVRRLRQRLEPLEGWRRIVSLRGVGLILASRPASERAVIDLRVHPSSEVFIGS